MGPGVLHDHPSPLQPGQARRQSLQRHRRPGPPVAAALLAPALDPQGGALEGRQFVLLPGLLATDGLPDRLVRQQPGICGAAFEPVAAERGDFPLMGRAGIQQVDMQDQQAAAGIRRLHLYREPLRPAAGAQLAGQTAGAGPLQGPIQQGLQGLLQRRLQRQRPPQAHAPDRFGLLQEQFERRLPGRPAVGPVGRGLGRSGRQRAQPLAHLTLQRVERLGAADQQAQVRRPVVTGVPVAQVGHELRALRLQGVLRAGMEARQRMPGMQLLGDGALHLLRAIGATRQILGVQDRTLAQQAFAAEQRAEQQIVQRSERRRPLAGGHLQQVQGLQGQRAGVVAPAVGMHIVGEVARPGASVAAEKQRVLDEMRQTRPASRLVEAARRQTAGQGDARRLRVVQQRHLHTVLQVQGAPRQGGKLAAHADHRMPETGSSLHVGVAPGNPAQVAPGTLPK